MIHDDARRATGAVLAEGGLVGHCVLIGARQAVTCAHVLSRAQARPTDPFRVCFRNLDNVERLATITAWVPFDPALKAGTDIAVLTFEGSPFSEPEPWVRIETQRPATDAEIVALDFQIGRHDGDPRGGTVHHGRGDVISLAGQGFVSDGMSGGGLFYRESGAHLLGIVSGKPIAEGQTEGYAIPADQILRLLPNQTNDPKIEAVMALRDLALPAFGDNFAPVMRRMFDRVLRLLAKPADAWDDEDIIDLVNLEIELHDGLSSDGSGTPIPRELAEKLRALNATMDAIGTKRTQPGELVSFSDDPEMSAHIAHAGSIVAELASDPMLNDPARVRVGALQDLLACAEHKQSVRLGLLSVNGEAAVRAVGEPFRAGNRVIMAAIGRKPQAAPPGTIFVDAVESWAPEMVVIPACPNGFLMGTPEGQEGRLDREQQHRVTIPQKFALARYALTFGEYDAYCAEAAVKQPDDENWGRDRRPVINVNWDEATACCAWLSERTGVDYRLPSEAEWEYACRGDASGRNETPFCPEVARAGAGAYITSDEANFDGTDTFNGSPEGVYREKSLPVDHADFRPNGFGLWQMHGNVWEWCADVYEEDYLSTPADGVAHVPQPLPEGHSRVVRGGSWSDNPQNLRSANRDRDEPDDRYNDFGFRPARTLLTP